MSKYVIFIQFWLKSRYRDRPAAKKKKKIPPLENVVNLKLLLSLVKKYQSVSVLYLGWCNTALMHRHDRAGRRRWLLRTAGVWQAPNPVGRGLEKARGKQDAVWLQSHFLPGMCLFKTSRPDSCWSVVSKMPSSCAASTEACEVFIIYLCVFIWWVVMFLESTTITWGELWSSSNLWDSPNGDPLLQYHRHLPATFKPVSHL